MTAAPPFEAGWAAPDTTRQPGIGGTLRARPEDFLVEEIPLYPPSGTGEHVYLFVQKQAMSTLDMVGVLARHFGVPKRDIGYAGLKDKRAITRQVVSVRLPGREVEDIPMLRDDRLTILWVDKHENKLRRGHLSGNRFSIKVRGVGFQAALPAQRALERMAREGMPNRIGPQRFGMLGNNHLIGRAIVLTRWQEALGHLLGPSDDHPEAQPESRASFAEGRYADAFAEMPGTLGAERVALRALAEGATPEQAVRSIDRSAVSFYVTAFQSAIFNAVLSA
ncbi:MAG: tRNA pseudouridine(13) synthase TruD, partial [Phycisphaerales bacterium JB041]